jgi:hypothetical protein
VAPDKFLVVPIIFNGWFADNVKVEKTTKGSVVVAKFVKPAGSAGFYKIRISRHIVSLWTDDQIVEESSFEFDGKPVYQDISFVPKFYTNESNTKGYYAELLKDGYVIWKMGKTYPPRLQVTES